MDLEGIPKQKFIFQQSLNQECYSWGWGRGLTKATNLYGENLMMKKN